MTTGDETAGTMAQASERLGADPSEEPTLREIARQAAGLVPGCELAGVVVRREAAWTSVAATDPVAAEADRLQLAFGEGPCHEVVTGGQVVAGDDLPTVRWPEWAALAADLGIRSTLAVPLRALAGSEGALTLYARAPGAFDDESRDLAVIFASLATTALHRAREVDRVNAAVAAEHRVGMTQGMLMARHRISEDEAFLLLGRLAAQVGSTVPAVVEELMRPWASPPEATGPRAAEHLDPPGRAG